MGDFERDINYMKEKVNEALSELSWDDSLVPEIMEDFFHTPMDAIEKSEGEMSDEHIEELFELLECEGEEE